MAKNIELRGVATHNLRSINVDIPLNKIIAVTGVSGSGKSSLVFDTLYAESYRRYVESLSSYTRQFMQALPKPKYKEILHLPPGVALKQKQQSRNLRSTVSKITEIDDYLQMLYSNHSQPHCIECQKALKAQSPNQVSEQILRDFDQKSVVILSPLESWRNIEGDSLREALMQLGYSRVELNNEIFRLDEHKDERNLSRYSAVIDRVKVNEDNKARLEESIHLAYKLSSGLCAVLIDKERQIFTKEYFCYDCKVKFPRPNLALFSSDHPAGACSECTGFGKTIEYDWRKIVPDGDLSLQDEGVAPWNFGSNVAWYTIARKNAKKHRIDVNKPFRDYSTEDFEWLAEGDGVAFTGVNGFMDWLQSKSYKPHYRIHRAKFLKYVTCSECAGKKLNKFALAFTVNGLSIDQLWSKSIAAFKSWFTQLDLGDQEEFNELKSKLEFLEEVGLGYVALDRNSSSLSGGEYQRVLLSKCIASYLTDTMYCLDEPSSGLHPLDVERLIKSIKKLQQLNNTVILVEHDPALMEAADEVISIGPQAGSKGGQVVYQGKPKDYLKTLNENTISRSEVAVKTGKYKNRIKFANITTNNLKNLSFSIPLNALTVVCGVSGSGKSSMVIDSVFPTLNSVLKKQSPRKGIKVNQDVIRNEIGSVHYVDQKSIGKSSRSNVATYLDFFLEIRKIFASTPGAKKLGLKESHFSFNTKGGRCEECKGLGVVTEDLSFLGDVTTSCPLCNGMRFTQDVLKVKYLDKTLIDILDMTIAEVKTFFSEHKKIVKICDYVEKMGLNYLTLGQHTSSFSGGEIQRLKLLSIIKETQSKKKSLLIIDEPSVGLANSDIDKLLTVFEILLEQGHTLLVVEHNMRLVKSADHIIELGPGAGDEGGEIIFEGAVSNLGGAKRSNTARFLEN